MGTNNKPPGKRGPKEKEITPDQVFELARIQCTEAEIAAVMGLTPQGFNYRKQKSEEIQNALQNGRECGKESLRRVQWQIAARGNPTMCIWLGKQYLDQTDKNETVAQVTTDSTGLEDRSMAELEKLAKLELVEGGKK